MLNIVVEIKAPEIVEVIRSLIGTLAGTRPVEAAPPEVQTQPVVPQVQQEQHPLPQQPPVQEQPQQQALPTTAVPTAAQTYTMDQLAVAATQLMDAGRRDDLVGLLSSFGVQALTMLPKEQYGTFATQLRAMGAKI